MKLDNDIYYDRTLHPEFAKLLEPSGDLGWLYTFVRNHSELDFLVGKNAGKEWISVYRGLSRVLTITRLKSDRNAITCEGAGAYKNLMDGSSFYGRRLTTDNFSDELEHLVEIVAQNPKFDRYYNNKKEGYYQNELSRKYGILGSSSDAFVIVDKEAAVGYRNQKVKNQMYGEVQASYKRIQRKISDTDAKRFGKNLHKKSIGNELDFVALHKDGRLLLIEYKNGSNTAGIYLSPLQIGMYVELFNLLNINYLKDSALRMLEQKQRIGLINSEWQAPPIKEITPILILSNYNKQSCAQKKFQEIMDTVREEKGADFLSNLETYNYTSEAGLEKWL